MTTLTVTAKCQVTLKKELLLHLGVSPGQKIEADKLPDGRIIVRAVDNTGDISDFVGSLVKNNIQPRSIEEIGTIAAQGWAKFE